MDVYINGIITKRMAFQNVPSQNYDDVFVCANGGFMGNLSDLKYYDKSLNVFEIMNLTIQGQNLSASSGNLTAPSNTDYLSNIVIVIIKCENLYTDWYSKNMN